jgi:hypothetical protein
MVKLAPANRGGSPSGWPRTAAHRGRNFVQIGGRVVLICAMLCFGIVAVLASPSPQVSDVAAKPAGKSPAESGPVVTYQNGQLTIDAENATLAAVLALVARHTGAVIEVPAGSGLEPIVEHTGPGPVNQVLTQLLRGSNFNFVIVNSFERPDWPTQVLLSVRGKDLQPENPVVSAPGTAAAAELPTAASAAPIPPPLDEGSPNPSNARPTPQALSEMMREKARQLREKPQP